MKKTKVELGKNPARQKVKRRNFKVVFKTEIEDLDKAIKFAFIEATTDKASGKNTHSTMIQLVNHFEIIETAEYLVLRGLSQNISETDRIEISRAFILFSIFAIIPDFQKSFLSSSKGEKTFMNQMEKVGQFLRSAKNFLPAGSAGYTSLRIELSSMEIHYLTSMNEIRKLKEILKLKQNALYRCGTILLLKEIEYKMQDKKDVSKLSLTGYFEFLLREKGILDKNSQTSKLLWNRYKNSSHRKKSKKMGNV